MDDEDARRAVEALVGRALPAWAALYPDLPDRLRAITASGAPEVRAAATAMLAAVEAAERRRLGRLEADFGLTPAQARLAAHIAAGGTIDEHADAAGIRITTARQHLKQVFQKLGVRRQSELAARLKGVG